MTTEERVKNGAIYWLASHYSVSTGAVSIVSITPLNQDDWTVHASCSKYQEVIQVDLKVFCTSYVFDVIDCQQK
jgi:hypothetical protein